METRREFVRIGEDLETAAAKNAQVSRHKAGDAERASHLLLATRKCYQHFALDYCLQVGSQTAAAPAVMWRGVHSCCSLVLSAQRLQDAAESRRPELSEWIYFLFKGHEELLRSGALCWMVETSPP